MTNKKKPQRDRYTLEQLQDLIAKQETRRTGAFYTMKLKSLLKRKKLIQNKCQSCGIKPEWQGKKLSLELDHIDGNWRNNSLENLRFLCPNCHYDTETHSTQPKKIRAIEPANNSWFKIYQKKIHWSKWERMRVTLISEVDKVCPVCNNESSRLVVKEIRKRKKGQDLRRENLKVLCYNCLKAK